MSGFSAPGAKLIESLVHGEVITRARGAALRGTPAEVVAELWRTPEVDAEALAQALASYMGLDYLAPDSVVHIDPGMATRIAAVDKRGVSGVPLALRDGAVVVAVDNPLESHLEDRLRDALEQRVRLCVVSAVTLESLRRTHLDPRARLTAHAHSLAVSAPASVSRTESGEGTGNGPIVRLVDTLLRTAVERGASDIHIEATRGRTQVRFRIDGVLQEAMEPLSDANHDSIVTRVKVLSELDVAERRAAQDGRFSLRVGEEQVDFRVSILPGEREDVTLRLLRHLDARACAWRLDELGFTSPMVDALRRAARHPQGLLLVTGPTGSGKTTTLYAVLGEMDCRREKVVTIEDPVEYRLDGVTQIAVNESRKFNFANGLRSVLRHDPDKIMVGEIRDRETAEIAVQSALTGHLVLSTVHANGALEAVNRFAHMGIAKPFVVDALHAVLAQRLVRVLCSRCKQPASVERGIELTEGERELLDRKRLFRAEGCQECGFTGYRGREAVGELLRFTPEFKEALHEKTGTQSLRALAQSQGMQTLRDQALEKVIAGKTSLQELARVTTVV